ncbi:hypothetical protein DFH29DRAFT_884047 [Suillus ampliporus]|nr:hypothetical protein DFH29DRAFT_884047 [Suillus ampliporus]
MSNFSDEDSMEGLGNCKAYLEDAKFRSTIAFLKSTTQYSESDTINTRCHGPSPLPIVWKEFGDHTSIARHMSQPQSGCNNWLENLIQLNSTLPRTEDPMLVDNIGEAPSYEPGEDASFDDFRSEAGDNDSEVVTDYFLQPPLAFEEGYTLLSLFDADENSVYRKTNLYYPFSSRREWQFASWLLRSGLSIGKINDFLALEMINDLPLSFSLARELRGRAESLPSGPRWKSQVIPMSHPTKSPAVLYWWDPLECIATLFNHPLLHNHIDYTACKVYSTAQKASRIYTEWMTGKHAWEMKLALPNGATLLGAILSSVPSYPRTRRDRVVHPLLISLANIHMNTRLKSSSNAFLLAALLPVPKFIHKNKQMREAMMLACVGRKTSPVTMAMYKDFGDAFQHEPHTRSKNSRATRNHVLDHDAQWIIHALGGSEIDFRFSIIQPTTGYRHFHGGISKLKQVTGRCHRDIQQSIIAISADAAPTGVVVADLGRIKATLDEFHMNKHAIIAAGLRQGKGGKAINNWQIPKLELMQNITHSICNSGVIAQWSADVTEHVHITEVKDPARSSNNNNYDLQICRYLDLATNLLDHSQHEDPGVFGDRFV